LTGKIVSENNVSSGTLNTQVKPETLDQSYVC